MDLDVDRLARSHLFVGALGSIAALKFAPGLSWPERVFNVGAGIACAVIVGPALIEWLPALGPRMQAGLIFAVGMFGLSVAAAVMDGIRGLNLAEIIGAWLPRRGRGGD